MESIPTSQALYQLAHRLATLRAGGRIRRSAARSYPADIRASGQESAFPMSGRYAGPSHQVANSCQAISVSGQDSP